MDSIKKMMLMLTVPSLFTLGCVNYLNPIQGSNNIISKTISTEDYDKIEVDGNFDVVLVSGNEGKIEVRTDDNLFDYIIIEAREGVLSIKVDEKNNIRPKQGIKVRVPFVEIDALELTGSGEIETKNSVIQTDTFEPVVTGSGEINVEVNTDKVIAEITGSGEIGITGNCNNLAVDITGSGDFEGKNLHSKNVTVLVTGSGSAYVHAKDYLKADVTGSGDILYNASPKDKHINVSGSGKVSSYN